VSQRAYACPLLCLPINFIFPTDKARCDAAERKSPEPTKVKTRSAEEAKRTGEDEEWRPRGRSFGRKAPEGPSRRGRASFSKVAQRTRTPVPILLSTAESMIESARSFVRRADRWRVPTLFPSLPPKEGTMEIGKEAIPLFAYVQSHRNFRGHAWLTGSAVSIREERQPETSFIRTTRVSRFNKILIFLDVLSQTFYPSRHSAHGTRGTRADHGDIYAPTVIGIMGEVVTRNPRYILAFCLLSYD